MTAGLSKLTSDLHLRPPCFLSPLVSISACQRFRFQPFSFCFARSLTTGRESDLQQARTTGHGDFKAEATPTRCAEDQSKRPACPERSHKIQSSTPFLIPVWSATCISFPSASFVKSAVLPTGPGSGCESQNRPSAGRRSCRVRCLSGCRYCLSA